MNWIWYTLAGLWTLDALRMRARLAAIPILPSAANGASDRYRFLTTPGVELDEATRSGAVAYADSQHLELMDLMPADIPALPAIGLSQMVDTKTYRANRVAVGHTTGYAVLVSEELLDRARVNPEPVLSIAELPRLVRKLRRFAGLRADIVLAPDLKATDDHLTGNWQVFADTVGGNAHAIFMLRAIMIIVLGLGLWLAPAAGLVALAAFHLQVAIVFAGLKIHPRDWFLTVLLRTPIEVMRWFQTLISRLRGERRSGPDPVEARRPYYRELLKNGIDGFFEPRRADCPLCGSTQIKPRIRNVDLIQRKPGRFTLEQCQSCQHTFQNPRLSPAGLTFYYADFYDGLGGSVAETMFRARPGLYESRAKVVEGIRKPSRWLDVGTGQGHFCSAARRQWPDAEFDGVDIAEGMDEAQRAGWMNRGYHGFFTEVAPKLAGFYDVVSMFHCLEHTPDQRAELAAARTVLSPGGLFVIEMPNPECSLGRIFGRFWLPWFQPQHLNMPTAKNLEKLLAEEGFEVVRVQFQEAHISIDFFSAAMMFFGALSPKPNLPWRPRPTWISYTRHFIVWNLGFPILLLAMGMDFVFGRLLRKAGVANAYRLVARKTAPPDRPEVGTAAFTEPIHSHV